MLEWTLNGMDTGMDAGMDAEMDAEMDAGMDARWNGKFVTYTHTIQVRSQDENIPCT